MLARPRPLQGDQRHARPPRGRRAAVLDRRAARQRAARDRHGGPAGRRRVRDRAVRRQLARPPRARSPSSSCEVIKQPLAMTGDLVVQVRGEHRGGGHAGPRRRPRHAAAPRRRRDVPGQGRGRRPAALRGRVRRHLARSGCGASASWPRRSSSASSSCTSSRRSSSRPAASRASRRSSAGRTTRLGILPPGQFIEMAERSGLIVPLTSFALDAAMAGVPRPGCRPASRCRSR